MAPRQNRQPAKVRRKAKEGKERPEGEVLVQMRQMDLPPAPEEISLVPVRASMGASAAGSTAAPAQDGPEGGGDTGSATQGATTQPDTAKTYSPGGSCAGKLGMQRIGTQEGSSSQEGSGGGSFGKRFEPKERTSSQEGSDGGSTERQLLQWQRTRGSSAQESGQPKAASSCSPGRGCSISQKGDPGALGTRMVAAAAAVECCAESLVEMPGAISRLGANAQDGLAGLPLGPEGPEKGAAKRDGVEFDFDVDAIVASIFDLAEQDENEDDDQTKANVEDIERMFSFDDGVFTPPRKSTATPQRARGSQADKSDDEVSEVSDQKVVLRAVPRWPVDAQSDHAQGKLVPLFCPQLISMPNVPVEDEADSRQTVLDSLAADMRAAVEQGENTLLLELMDEYVAVLKEVKRDQG